MGDASACKQGVGWLSELTGSPAGGPEEAIGDGEAGPPLSTNVVTRRHAYTPCDAHPTMAHGFSRLRLRSARRLTVRRGWAAPGPSAFQNVPHCNSTGQPARREWGSCFPSRRHNAPHHGGLCGVEVLLAPIRPRAANGT